jgi:hypothetical protein
MAHHGAELKAGFPVSKSKGIPFIFVTGFIVFLVVAVAGRRLMLKWRHWLPGAEDGRSLIEAVKSAACSFMS